MRRSKVYMIEISERGKREDEVEGMSTYITTVSSPKEVPLNAGKFTSY